MKSLLGLIVLSLLLTGCGPSKQEILRMQALEAQRIAAEEAAARKAAAQREQRIIERRQLAYETLQDQAVLKKDEIKQLFSQPANINLSDTYFFKIDLQPEKYNYDEKHQNFTIIGMRRLSLSSAFSDLIQQWNSRTGLEITLLAESDTNDELVTLIPNVKERTLLENKNPNWSWDKGLFTDFIWRVSPEKAWDLTSERSAYLQVGLRFCNNQNCIKRYSHNGKTIQGIGAEVMSILVVDGRTQKALAEFIRPAR